MFIKEESRWQQTVQQTSNRHVTANKNEKNEKKSNRRKPIYEETSIFYQLALTHYEEVKINHREGKAPNLQNWANDFRLIVERNVRKVEQIIHLMKWSGQYAFWHQMVAQVQQSRALA